MSSPVKRAGCDLTAGLQRRRLKLRRSSAPAQQRQSTSSAPSITVRPPALRASDSGMTSTHAVSLPSTIRCTRSHVVNGTLLSTPDRMSARSMTTTPNLPACSTRLSALNARSTCVRADSGRLKTADRESTTTDRNRRARPTPERRRADHTCPSARRCRRGPSRRHQLKQHRRPPGRVRSGKLRDLTPRQPAFQEAAAQKRVEGAMSDGINAAASDRSSDGNDVVSVRSSFRARSAVSSAARAYSPYFRLTDYRRKSDETSSAASNAAHNRPS